MSTAKTVIGFDDNLANRFQDFAPTQYAVGKLRAARTPYNRDGTTVINDANQILRPGLYLMKLDNNSKNTAGFKAGVLYLYLLTPDPDESANGGHVVESAKTATMELRQIGYFQNGSVEKIMTRVGIPSTSTYNDANRVQLLKQIDSSTTGVTFVVELGMWVHHYTSNSQFIIEPAVTWSDWREVAGGGGESVTYHFDTTKTNGVGLTTTDPNTYAATADFATEQTAGVVKMAGAVSRVLDESYKYKVPNINAIYNEFTSVYNGLMAVSTVAMTASSAASRAASSANDVSRVLSDHISNNHPVSYGYANLENSGGVVLTANNISSIGTVYARAKYTVPTLDAAYNASSALRSAINLVSTTLTSHITNHPGGGEGVLITGVNWPLIIQPEGQATGDPFLNLLFDMTSVYAGVQFKSVQFYDETEEPTSSGLVAVGNPAGIGQWGVVKTTDSIESYSHTDIVEPMIGGYVDEFTVPTVNAVYNASSALSTYTAGVSNAMALVSTTLLNHITNHPGGGGSYDYATTETSGITRLATAAEAKAGVDASAVITPSTLLAALDEYLKTHTW